MRMLISKPPIRLCGQVIELWSLRGQPQGQYSGLPKPYVELVVSLSGLHLWQTCPDSSPIVFKDGWITPLQSGPKFAETFGPLHLIGARLTIDTAAELFGTEINGDSGIPTPLNCLIGNEAARLREQLFDLETETKRLQHLGRWIEARLSDRISFDLPPLSVMSRMGWRTDALANLMGLSARGLHKKFKTKYGVGPKFWLQLNRFNAVLNSNIARDGIAATASEHGYTDQSHMTAEFRRFAGRPPKGYLAIRRCEQAPDKAPHFLPISK